MGDDKVPMEMQHAQWARDKNKRLHAELDALRRLGDAMADACEVSSKNAPVDGCLVCRAEWYNSGPPVHNADCPVAAWRERKGSE